MLIIIIFVIGVLFGCVETSLYYRQKHVGTLRIDTSEPSEGTYFFLEIESGKANAISNQNVILLTVNTENYI